ncbi:class I SAM-dependent methyltransferase [Ktedonobacter racemifer]|uniref:Methyltransferase type 11 n=1 Tax=Ktedonobacter racemifer DSM 44963 TaxID=485913 RepID=D6TWV9_KTERA|nr:class I SAM-dependent methyltransferase [Ktedonobacter racemifer]EFH84692.1 Methyltransferase type 11 [Ktedonobacter racemifer DSM 44963]
MTPLSIPLQSGQGLHFLAKNERQVLSRASHLLVPQVHEDRGYPSPLPPGEALYPFYTPSDPLVLDEEVLVLPIHPLEWRRRTQQARMLLQHCGTPLPERHEGRPLARILELSIDPHGEWLRQVASLHPTTEVIGVTSQEMYARQAAFFAAVQGCRNVHVQVCPLSRPLPFPAESMDLINGRFLHASLPEHLWPLLLEECVRLLRPGGVLHLLECLRGESTSAAAGTLYAAYRHSLERRRVASRPSLPGARTIRAFQPEHLPLRLAKAGLVAVEQQKSLLDFSAGMPFHGTLREQADDFFQLVAPLCTHHHAPLSLEAYQQAYHEMQLELLEPTFRGYWHLCALWGYKPYARVLRPIPSIHRGQPCSHRHGQPCALFPMPKDVQQREPEPSEEADQTHDRSAERS